LQALFFLLILFPMATLKNVQSQIPGGFRFYVPATKFSAAPFSSIDSIVQQLISHRQGRPDLTAKFGWSLDPAIVRREVEDYQVQLCIQNGWRDYIVGDEQSPPFQHQRVNPLKKLGAVVGGSEVLVDWLADGAPAVVPELSSHRAGICSKCPMNGQGGWETWFTVAVSNAIRAAVAKAKQRNLTTPFDEQIGVCETCLCPLKLKVHLPIQNILEKIKPEVRAALHPGCWITAEST